MESSGMSPKRVSFRAVSLSEVKEGNWDGIGMVLSPETKVLGDRVRPVLDPMLQCH